MFNCEVCQSDSLTKPLVLGDFPLCDDLSLIGSPSRVKTYSQSIVLCRDCLTAHQLFPVAKIDLFKPNYHYRAALTRDVLDGMAKLVEHVANFMNISNPQLVLDIGCNDGSLLKMFKEKLGFKVIGVDPTDAIDDAVDEVDGAYKEFFDCELASRILRDFGKPDVITFTNVFAHIEDLPALLQALQILIGEETIVVIENHYLGEILDKYQFDTFYHEHPRTYSAHSFKFIAKQLGLTINEIQFPSRYGGNIRVTMSKRKLEKTQVEQVFEGEKSFIRKFEEFEKVYKAWLTHSKAQLRELEARGPFIGKSLPGRAVMLLNALNITEAQMPILYEQSKSPKVGHYVPGTQIKILPDTELANSRGTIIVWAWHIIDEVTEQLEGLGFKGEVWTPLPKFELFKILE
jgi:SAM-dependent methyltransferase